MVFTQLLPTYTLQLLTKDEVRAEHGGGDVSPQRGCYPPSPPLTLICQLPHAGKRGSDVCRSLCIDKSKSEQSKLFLSSSFG